ELPEDPFHQTQQDLIEREQIQAKQDRSDDDDDGCRVHLFLRRPRHPLQLVSDLAKEQPHALDAAARRLFDCLKPSWFVSHVRSHFRLYVTYRPPPRCALRWASRWLANRRSRVSHVSEGWQARRESSAEPP